MKGKKRVVSIFLILVCILGGTVFVNRYVFLDLIGKHVEERLTIKSQV